MLIRERLNPAGLRSGEGSGRRVPREGFGARNVGFLLVLHRFSRKNVVKLDFFEFLDFDVILRLL